MTKRRTSLFQRAERCRPPRRNIFALLVALFCGGLAGLIAGFLLAPRSGKETRRQLLEKVKPGGSDPQGRTTLSNWGNYPRPAVKIYEFDTVETLRQIVTRTDNVIARGNGRSYGDQSLAPNIISCLKYNRFLDFDTEAGIMRCQSGVILSELLDVIVPKGWFLPVTPGTKQVTVGGAIAADVHGKSQHKAGNFSDHLLDIELMLADGRVVKCSPQENTELFWTTCGGMGLTGVILNATLKLIPVETAYFKQQSIKAKNLDHLMDLFEESESWPYSVAWIDCLTRGDSMGRGILMRGDHARVADLPDEARRRDPLNLKPKLRLNVPISFPSFALNSLSMRIFNELYYGKQFAERVDAVVDYNTFFYPLDIISNWNRVYGSRGFTQYQFILPKKNSREGMHRILERITHSGMVSFLAVLKLYGRQHGYLPFAMEGYSLALDFPIQPGLFEFLDELDQIVLSYGGRLYLTKDVRMSQGTFKQSYPQVDKFIENVRQINTSGKFRSYQSDRVGITQ
ncbi:MAG: Decaprenylphosphoryl-beta-D-ribose oxidase [Anaerolineae bacterium]|nr:Decaprenylphosphoryl-beta-D-ribose oxidase [Anaerolineae bacterium]